LKTESSKRLVPVHSHLVALGLVDYVEEQRAVGEKFLFSRAAQLMKPEGALADWFPKYRRKVGIDGKRKTFHSLRHTFSQFLADAGAQDSTVSDLMGHADGSMTHGRYGSRASVARLRDAVELLDFREPLSGLTKPTKP
jgi:integrase